MGRRNLNTNQSLNTNGIDQMKDPSFGCDLRGYLSHSSLFNCYAH